MYEEAVIEELRKSRVELVLSLPCDRNKRFTDLVHASIRTVDLAKEEDGVGIAAGAYLAGTRSVISIQSSGLGNMMNAIMSLADCYKLPLVILASWRGVDDEKIEAQKHFNVKIPRMLEVFGIGCVDVFEESDIASISNAVEKAYSSGSITVILVHPGLWGGAERVPSVYPLRSREVELCVRANVPEPSWSRLDAITSLMDAISDDVAVVTNIGVPSKEAYAARDRPLNFYMTGSFGQATPIGLGVALCSDRRVVVIDGDGSLLTDNILPVVAAEDPGNLTIVCLDNGTFGSTGNQINHAYRTLDMGCFAAGCGISGVARAHDDVTLREALSSGCRFVQTYVRPGNSNSPGIPLSAAEIRDRFMRAL